MPHDPDEVRRIQLADERLAGLGIASADRAAARRTMVALIAAEEQAASAAHDVKAECQAERDRIRAVVRLGVDQGKGRQALRAALLAPISPDAARGLLAAMKPDTEASSEALAIPALVAFGTVAAQAERRRLTSAFSRPEAAGRFRATVALALDGDGGLTADQIAPLLASLPLEAPARTAAEILAARAEGLGEFGAGAGEVVASRAEIATAGWSKAVQKANQAIGAASAITPEVVGQVAGPFDRGAA